MSVPPTEPKRRTRRPPAWAVLPVLTVLLVLSMALAAAHGAVSIDPAAAVRLVLNHLHLTAFPATWQPQEEAILLAYRLPRVVAAAFVGAALAVTGVLFQGLLRNPLADPYVVGTSGGATLGAAAGMLVGGSLSFLGFGAVPLAAFAGALLTMLLVIQLAGVGGRLPVVTVLLAGLAISTILGYMVSLLLVLQNGLQLQLPQLYAWLLGGISVVGWGQIQVIGPLVLAGVAAALWFGRALNAFSLGEDGAARLGIDVEREKRLILGLGSLLTGAAVSISGLIGFVGLIVPHILRLLLGPDHRVLVPASALGGAVFLVLADLIARTALQWPLVRAVFHSTGGELPVGIVTALLGGPFFLWLLRRSRREYQW